MKLRCIDNSGLEHLLTHGEIYEGVESIGYGIGPCYAVRMNREGATDQKFFKRRFEVIHEQAEVVIAHPYTVLTWTKDRGFQPCGAVFKTAEAVHDWITGLFDPGAQVAYVHTPSGCLYTPNAIKTLGLNLWKEVNKE